MRSLRGALVVASVMVACLVAAPMAGAANWVSTSAFPSGAPEGAGARGIAIDQTTGDVYVSLFLTPPFNPGNISKFDSSGTQIGSPFSTGGTDRFIGVAVSPASAANAGNVYGATAFGVGDDSLHTFTSSGTPTGTPFVFVDHPGGQIASDGEGNIYVLHGDSPPIITKYSPSGEVLDTFDCSGCPNDAGQFEFFSVAVDSAGDIYVVDDANDQVLKLDPEGEFLSVLQSGLHAGAVAVDSATGTVFVGDLVAGVETHIVAYDANGAEIADFGGDVLGHAQSDPSGLGQIAVNEATEDVYTVDVDSGLVIVFSPVAPAPTTTAASALAQTNATLNGTVNPNEGGAITSCEFEWGTTTAYSGGTVPCASNPPDGNSAVAVSGALPGLSANTTYHFQLVVDNGSGAVKGGDQEFKTLPPAPTPTTGAASGLGQSAATLNGTLNANGFDAECSFEYGTSLAYGTSVPCSINPVKGSSATAVSAAIAGLSAATTYHYRVVGKGAGGKAEGNDATFTTPSAPALPAPPSPTPPAATPPVTSPPPAKKPLKCKKGFKKKTVKGKAKCVKVKKKHKKH